MRLETEEQTTLSESEDKIMTWDPNAVAISYLKHPIVLAVANANTQANVKRVNRQIDRVVDKYDSTYPLPTTYNFRGLTAKDRLIASLKRSAYGNPIDLQNPIFARRAKNGYKFTDRRAVIREFLAIGSYSTKLDEQILIQENSQAEKTASRSLTWPWEVVGDKLAEGVFHYIGVPKNCNMKILQRSLKELSSWLPNRTLVPMDRNKVYSKQDLTPEEIKEFYTDNGYTPMDKTTSSGPPYFLPMWYASEETRHRNARLYQVVTEAHEDILRTCSINHQKLSKRDDSLVIMAQLNKRTDAKGELDLLFKSLRMVAGVEKWETIEAKTLTIPLTNYLKQLMFSKTLVRPFAAMMGNKYSDTSMHSMLLAAKQRTVVCGDISAYDNSKSQEITLLIAEVVSNCFRHEEIRNLYYYLNRTAYMRMGMATPNHLYLPQPCTQASGSGFTLLNNCLYLVVCILYGHYSDAWKINSFCVQGDDFVLDAEGATPEIVNQVFSDLGLEASISKQFYEAGYAHFLQNLHTDEFPGGIASISRTLGHMMAPEKLTSKVASEEIPYLVTIRALSQLHNCEFHPKFKDVVDFVKEYDKHRLYEDKTFNQIVDSSGEAGKDVLLEYTSEFRKGAGSITGEMQLVNWARVGKEVPLPNQRFPHVYGETYLDVLDNDGILITTT